MSYDPDAQGAADEAESRDVMERILDELIKIRLQLEHITEEQITEEDFTDEEIDK